MAKTKRLKNKKNKATIGTRRTDYNKRRKGLLSVVIPWMRRFGVGVALIVGVIWLGAWFTLSGSLDRTANWTHNQFLQASSDWGFTVENILVEGRVHTDASTLTAMINLQKGDPLFALNPKEAKNLVQQIGWVEDVRIERRLPDTIYIGLTERKPLALWQAKKRMKLLDENGEIIVTNNLQRFADLVMLTGEDAPQHASMLIQTLKAEPDIYSRIETANWIGERRWDIGLNNGVSVKLPEHDVGLALRRLAEAQSNDSLLDKDIKSIDMRELDRISVRTKPGQVQEYQNSLKIDAATRGKSGSNI